MTIRPETDELIAYLNSVMAVDRFAVAELFMWRVAANSGLVKHPTVQVDAPPLRLTTIGRYYRLGALGLLNGFCGAIDSGPHKGAGPIATEPLDGRPVRFIRREDLPPP